MGTYPVLFIAEVIGPRKCQQGIIADELSWQRDVHFELAANCVIDCVVFAIRPVAASQLIFKRQLLEGLNEFHEGVWRLGVHKILNRTSC